MCNLALIVIFRTNFSNTAGVLGHLGRMVRFSSFFENSPLLLCLFVNFLVLENKTEQTKLEVFKTSKKKEERTTNRQEGKLPPGVRSSLRPT